ncbi:hypothetical protein PIB30_051680 [Stylosanthes scabra]|uniref:Uncharacterized protein n=1 Tax=Stylosanthes scabra TaxID=79078 RepID=A0ABU6TK41_9FABA|nr:hypothetical protein [Stylosanthes scabra]
MWGIRDDEQGGDTWEENVARYQSFVVDAFPHQYAWTDNEPAEDFEEELNPEAKKLFDLLASVRKPLWEGYAFSKLSIATRMFATKSEHNHSQTAEFDQWKSTVSQMYSFMTQMQGSSSSAMPPPLPPPQSSAPRPPRPPPAATAGAHTAADQHLDDDGSFADDEDYD